MFTTLQTIGKNAARRASVALLFSSVLLAGCAGGVTNASQYSAAPQVRPDTIYVYSFDSTPDQVKLDNSGVAQKLKARFTGASASAEQSSDAVAVREQVADEIVHKLQSMGLHAIRSDMPAPADQNVLLIKGNFETIDAGNRRRRTLIGLGAGESEVGTSVQILYKPAGGVPTLVQRFDATANSGKAPGVAESAGVGAATGNIAMSAAIGGGVHAVSETRHDTVSQDAKRLGDSIAKQIAQIGVSEGWMSTDHIK
ncbi:MAG TPA: DUF4410 domain-containing protein [Paraburkholderia sp.]|jgi:hypothetical protein